LAAAAFRLADRGVFDLARAWALISENPARAAGLADRGRVAEGLRADFVLVDPRHERIVATITQGEIAWVASGFANGARRRPLLKGAC